ncbi:MAG: EamA family transporter [Muribaculaceae bacterium]|nr:EamA family transporter [Muribaculaceae bacterium]
MKDGKLKGHAAVLLANVIFGLAVPMSSFLLAPTSGVNGEAWLGPLGYIATRCFFAAIIFWIIQCFLPKEKVERKDLWVIILGGVMGFAVSQTFTAWSLYYANPVYFSFVGALCPIAVMLGAWMTLGERITGIKIVGVVLGILGALLMVYMSATGGSGDGINNLLGIGFALLSLLTWVIYLLITRKVSQKYSSVTQMKWTFLASAVIMLPLTAIMEGPQLLYTSACTWQAAGATAFVVLLATVLGYFMIPYAMKFINATTVSTYTNLQPVVASIVAFSIGQAMLTWDKPVAGVLVLLSAYIVTLEPKKEKDQ